MRIATAVMFVHDLDASVSFYRELLDMEVTVRTSGAALLFGSDSFQLYLRQMGRNARHAPGSVGVQYVIWTAADDADLRRCERFLARRGAHVKTQKDDGFALVEGRDPSGVPVVVTYPGPDDLIRHRIMSRIST